MSKLKFEQIDANNQCTFLFTMIEMIAAEECKSIQDFAKAKGQTPFEVWSKFCAGAGLDECEPWNGYPSELSEETIKNSPGATPELTRSASWGGHFDAPEQPAYGRFPSVARRPDVNALAAAIAVGSRVNQRVLGVCLSDRRSVRTS